jgi:hypothetical protein
MEAMRIPTVGKLIIDCWVRAEEALRENVRKKFPDRDEEMITDLFHAELEDELAKVSGSGAVAQAFLVDLKSAFPKVDINDLRSKIARGLIATVSFHPRKKEEKTGGDLGIVLVRPDVQETLYGWSELTIDRDYKRGLLCQAKIFRRNSKWGELSRTQQQTLPNKLKYFALLLYRYADQNGERRELISFIWQLAVDATVEEVKQWLAADKFPNPQNSQQLLGALVRDEIGTDDKEIIEREIAPPLRPSLVIKIGWKNDDGPASVHVQQRSTATVSQPLVQYQ